MVFCRSSESLSDSVALESPGKHRLPYWGTVQRVWHMLGDTMPGNTQCVTPQGAERVGHLNSHSVQSAPLHLSQPRGTPRCNHPYGLICPHQEVTSYHPEKEMGTDSSFLSTLCPQIGSPCLPGLSRATESDTDSEEQKTIY